MTPRCRLGRGGRRHIAAAIPGSSVRCVSVRAGVMASSVLPATSASLARASSSAVISLAPKALVAADATAANATGALSPCCFWACSVKRTGGFTSHPPYGWTSRRPWPSAWRQQGWQRSPTRRPLSPPSRRLAHLRACGRWERLDLLDGDGPLAALTLSKAAALSVYVSFAQTAAASVPSSSIPTAAS